MGKLINRYKYNGASELTEELDLYQYETPFRGYDAQLGRFHQIDALAENSYLYTPYHYGYNNPVSFQDPTGLDPMSDAEKLVQDLWHRSGKYGGTFHNRGNGTFSENLFDGYQSGALWGANTLELNNWWGTSGADQDALKHYLKANNMDWVVLKTITVKGYWKNQSWVITNLYSVHEQLKANGFEGFANFTYFEGGSPFRRYGDGWGGDGHGKQSNGWSSFNTLTGGLGLASGVKDMMIEGGAALNRSIHISKVNQTSIIRTYGTSGAKYLNISKRLGVLGSAVTTVYSLSNVYNQFEAGGMDEVLNNRDVLDAGVGLVGVTSFFLLSNPVGWFIGAGVLIYGGATMIYDAVNEK